VLADYEILDTPPEQGFDELVQLAADLCGTAIALVCIVGRDRAWVKAGIGLDSAAVVPTQLGLFSHVVTQRELLEVPDLHEDRRFRPAEAEKAETSRGGIRFFAGAPLLTDEGAVLGTLCVLDFTPRTLTDQQRAGLRALAHQTVAQLALRRAILRAQRAEQELESRDEQFRAIAETTREWIREIDPQGIITYSNPAVEQILGFAVADLVGHNVAEFVHDDDLEGLVARLEDFGREPRDLSVPATRYIYRDGGYRWLEGSVSPMFAPSGALLGGRGALRDVSDRIEMQQQLIDLAGLDDLTALQNRRGFLRSAEDQLKVARRRETPLVLLFIDVDGLKTVNDSHGHAAGDLLLEDTASLLTATFRESDVIARVGGDEFCVLLTSDASEAWLAVRRLLVAIEDHHEVSAGERPFRLSLSIGSATFDPHHPRSIEQLMQQADHAMYANKRAKRTQVANGGTRSA
jgi:diguanylate cyclase (GGDEF)-like protein/PAS domain S-box-containing protein